MTRSRKKTPIIGHCGGSEKKDKQICNRKLRRKAKENLNKDPDNYVDPKQNEMFNVWAMAKDGKHWIGNICKEWLTKYMRK